MRMMANQWLWHSRKKITVSYFGQKFYAFYSWFADKCAASILTVSASAFMPNCISRDESVLSSAATRRVSAPPPPPADPLMAVIIISSAASRVVAAPIFCARSVNCR
eukprot:GHVT01067075.1.p1 GENE.GHVT01067075.1~~GHVT01067075.1.p1  ORF type:complete len:107 (-),score=6.72 GHVT01067075.1:178-498(-)